MNKVISFGMAAVAAAVFSGCGTLFYKERIGQPTSAEIDPTVMVLDCCGLLFGIIPGVVALVLDFNNDTIYYTESEWQSRVNAAGGVNTAGMKSIHCEDMSLDGINRALSAELGHSVDVRSMQAAR